MTGNPFDFLVCTLHCFSPNIPILLPFFSSVRSGGSSTDSVCLLCGRRAICSGSGARYRHRNKTRPTSVMPADPMKRSSHPWIISSALLSRGATTFPADIAATQYGIIRGWRRKKCSVMKALLWTIKISLWRIALDGSFVFAVVVLWRVLTVR